MRKLVIVAALSIAAAGAGIGIAASAHGRPLRSHAPALSAPGAPRMPEDLGRGEQLVLVVGGVFPTQETASAAAMPFGDLQGYYAVPLRQFRGLRAQLPEPLRAAGGDPYALVSAFRTEEGAQEFARLAQDAGRPAFVTARVTSLGGEYAGLGQEAAPGGAGPLLHAIPASLPGAGLRGAKR